MVNEPVFYFVSAVLIFTVGFFVLFSVEKLSALWVKNAGYAATIMLWFSSVLLLVSGLPRPCPFSRGERPLPPSFARQNGESIGRIQPPGDCPAIYGQPGISVPRNAMDPEKR